MVLYDPFGSVSEIKRVSDFPLANALDELSVSVY